MKTLLLSSIFIVGSYCQCVGTGCSGGGSAVSSVFTRTGAVTATAGDYTQEQITATTAKPAFYYCPTSAYSTAVYTCSTGLGLTNPPPPTGTLILVDMLQACTDTLNIGVTIDSLATKLPGYADGATTLSIGACKSGSATMLLKVVKLSASNFLLKIVAIGVNPVCSGFGGGIYYSTSGDYGCTGDFIFGSEANALYAKRMKNNTATVTFSATPVFDLSLGDQKITLTGNVTSSTFSGGVAGQFVTFYICEDGTGLRTFVWPTAFKGAATLVTTASTCSVYLFKSFDGTTYYSINTTAQ